MKCFSKNHFKRPAYELAPLLLGCQIECRGVLATITETEAYHGQDDLACHGSKGLTERTKTLYASAGHLYCYLCYGMHVMLNIVSSEEGLPSAVLIRGIEVLKGEGLARKRRGQLACSRVKLCNGPGKAAQALAITRQDNALMLGEKACPVKIYEPKQLLEAKHPDQLEDPERPDMTNIVVGPRVGVAYAGKEWSNKKWRFILAGFPGVVQKEYSF
ncbi:MAG: DNA-3-methyladenine glycosylase [Planctomycetes bacterium]|nr:DNA-3-methyladenine glycosylase [Planctomycetota bacterium]